MSTPLKPNDPARFLFITTEQIATSTISRPGCFICEDAEFIMAGLPLCRICEHCEGHVPADHDVCDDCGREETTAY